MRKLTLTAGLAASVALLVIGTYLFSGPGLEQATTAADAGEPGSGPLDGQRFLSELGLVGSPPDIEDTLVFENGMFVSTECERRCNYPASPYFVRREGETLRFISETRCPHKDATIVWRGTVENGTIKGESTWTVNRWYWSVETKFLFEGKLANQAS